MQPQSGTPFAFKHKQRKLMILQFQTANRLFECMGKDRWEITKNESQQADFIIEDSQFAFIFLSLKYHIESNPKYIAQKLHAFKTSKDFDKHKKRILLLLCDTDDNREVVMYLHRIADETSMTVLCGFSFQEIAAYINTFIQCSNNAQFAKQYLQNKK